MSNIYLKSYNSEWPIIYQDEKKRILPLINNWIKDIEHVGSTAIPDLSAKPTIDICIGVSSLGESGAYVVSELEKLGYEYLAWLENQIPERRYLQKLDAEGGHLFHIHVVLYEKELWNNHINFRNYLISYPEVKADYERLKQMLQEKFSNNREAYTEGKSAFIQDVLARVLMKNNNNESL